MPEPGSAVCEYTLYFIKDATALDRSYDKKLKAYVYVKYYLWKQKSSKWLLCRCYRVAFEYLTRDRIQLNLGKDGPSCC